MSGVLDKLDEKDLHISLAQRQKIVALKTALHEPGFGLQKDQFEEMRQSVSLIIHTAWPVNFNIPLTSFEPLIKGVNNLINFSLSVNLPSPAVMLFCSSISATTGSHATDIPEAPMHDLTSALNMGYGRSKLVGENVVANARSAGARTYALRIGQVSGHSTKGLWNDTEALPLMVRSCLTLHALPSVSKYCSWIPVDKLASIILEIASRCSSHSPNRVSAQDSIYNLSNPLAFPWSSLLDNLRYDGFDFETVAFDTWLDKLRDSAHRHEEHVNPAVKLVDHYRAMYGQYDQTEESHHNTRKIFRTEKAQRDSEVFKDGVKIIEEGVLDCYSRDWLARWTKGL